MFYCVDAIPDDSDALIVSFWVPKWYADQRDSFYHMWKERIKAAWAMLRGKKFHLEEILIEDKKDIERFKDWVNSL